MKKNILIIYNEVYSDSGNLTIGGIQAYLKELSLTLYNHNYNVTIIQRGNETKNTVINKIKINYIKINNKSIKTIGIHLLKKYIEKNKILKDDLIIWGTDSIAYNYPKCKNISIQHGIAFDLLPTNNFTKIFNHSFFLKIYKLMQRNASLKYFNKVKYRVCVDYNYQNWYRTFSIRSDDLNIKVIPNFTKIKYPFLEKKNNKLIKILFARRFVEKRGVILMINATKKLLAEYQNIEITFAGSGPMRDLISELTEFNSRVKITNYLHENSLDFHKNFDIAVIPTIGSEGTSLSLLEAMASSCTVIASDVGGITNIIIDGFNGILIRPNENELFFSLKKLINDSEYKNFLSYNAYQTVKNGFSDKIWSEKWIKFIDNIEST